jgi:hypothetical protein
MSNNIWGHPEITTEVIQASMKRARIARSNALWDLLGQLFSRPEHKADDADVHHAARTGFRLG